jgi:C4-dicarboxylate-specific signal transduction histidine kinase
VHQYLERRNLKSRLERAEGLYHITMESLQRALVNVEALEGYTIQDRSDFQECRVEDVLSKVLDDHQLELEGIEVTRVLETASYVLHANALKLYDIFRNLISNAIDAMEETPKPRLRIETQLTDGRHQTIITDTGCGMSEEVRQHIFEPFFTTKELVNGRPQGLGLFNVWRLVEQHDGQIETSSNEGSGSRFIVTLKVT